MNKNSKIWLEEAKWDLENAEILFRNERYSTAVFQSQQASEKAVKALLFFRNINGWGHSISELLLKYKEITDRDIEEIFKYALKLDKDYIPTRYPDSLPGIAPHNAYTKEEAEKSIQKAKEIFSFIEREIEFFERADENEKEE